MTDKRILNFDIESAEIVEDNPDSRFMTAKIQAFSSDRNRHGMYCSEETLQKTAHTIYNMPIIYNIVKSMNDFGSHADPDKTLIAGFVVPDSAKFERLPDSRLGFMILAKIWKRYAPKVIEILKRESGKTKISVEMELLDYGDMDNGLVEMKDFSYLGACLLGQSIVEASQGAHMEVLSFAEENAKYTEDYLKEFSSKYNDIDFTIPENIKKNTEKGLQMYKQSKQKATSVTLATARFIGKNQIISPEKIKHIYKYLSSHLNKPKDKKTPNGAYMSWLMYGGDQAYEWSKSIVEKMDEIDKKRVSYFGNILTFPYDSLRDINPALRGIDPPITLAQANAIARQADAVGADKGGWGIAISHFKKTHKIEDGRWVKKENMGDVSPKEELSVNDEEKDVKEKEEEMAVEEKEQPKEEMSAEEVKMESPEEKEEEEKEEQEEEKEEQEEEKEDKTEKMSLDSNLDMAALLAMLADETEDYKQLAASHESGTVDYAVLCSAMYKKMCKMSEEMKSKTDAYMSENEDLKKFKAGVESERFAYEVESTLNEVSGTMPKEEIVNAREDSKNFGIDTIDAWKNKTKALAFTFVKDKKTEDAPKRVGLPFVRSDTAHSSSPWKR